MENNSQQIEEQEVLAQDVAQVDEQQAEGGILCDYKQKLDEKEAKKEKRKSLMQLIKYALCAGSAGVLQFLMFTLLDNVIPHNGKTIHFIVEDMDLVTFIATTVALCTSILWNFTMNRKFTFKDASNVPKAMILAFMFYVPFYPFQTWYVYTVKTALVDAGLGMAFAGVLAEITVMLINFTLEFMWQKFVVFRKKKDKKKKDEQDLAQEDAPTTSLDVETGDSVVDSAENDKAEL